MIPIEFEGMNAIFGKNQPEYLPLPARIGKDGDVLSCWKLSPEEIQMIVKTGVIWISQLTFNDSLQPICPMVTGDTVAKPYEIGDDEINIICDE